MRTWHQFVRSNARKLVRRLWPAGGAEGDIPFADLEDDRLCHILRRLEREMLMDHAPYPALRELAVSRGLNWTETGRIVDFELCDTEGAEAGGGRVCINPAGVEVNVAFAGGALTGKIFLPWADIDRKRAEVQALHQPAGEAGPTRTMDLP